MKPGQIRIFLLVYNITFRIAGVNKVVRLIYHINNELP